MIKDITLGQFFPGSSVLHKLDPRMKIILLILYIVVLFIAKSVVSYILIIISTVLLIYLSKIPFKLYFKGLKPLIFIIIFTGLLNVLYSQGPYICEFWIFKISINGIINAVKMIIRIILLVMSTSILTYTTSPVLLTSGLERLLSPLKVIKVPVHEFSMMMTIALRFIPTLLEETDKIMSAQKARGADFESGGLMKRIKALVPIIIPLLVSAVRRAEELATAMQCRCYNGDSKNRTRFVQYSLCVRDYISAAAVIIILTAVWLLNGLLIFGI